MNSSTSSTQTLGVRSTPTVHVQVRSFLPLTFPVCFNWYSLIILIVIFSRLNIFSTKISTVKGYLQRPVELYLRPCEYIITQLLWNCRMGQNVEEKILSAASKIKIKIKKEKRYHCASSLTVQQILPWVRHVVSHQLKWKTSLKVIVFLRATDRKYQKSHDRQEISDFILFHLNVPFGELFSKITIKSSTALSFF